MFAGNNGYSYINSTGQEFSAGFSNSLVPKGPHALSFAQRGGGKSKGKSRKINKRKIKNISNMYKMPVRKLKHYKKSLKRKLNETKKRVRFSRGRRSRKYKHMKGGSTVSYAVAGIPLAANESALANGLYSVIQGSSLPYNHFAKG
jgi:hypothetical protein